MTYQWDFSWVYQYRGALWEGIVWTIRLNALVLLIGSVFGVLVAGARIARWRSLSWPAIVFIELFRAFPVLVLLIWFHYVFPAVTGIRLGAFVSAVISLSLNLAAVVGDIVRGGIQSVQKGQTEAAYALGMSGWQVARRITLPITIRTLMPSLVSQYINVLKLSALASVIGVPEILHSASLCINQTYRPLEFYTFVALAFLLIILPCTWLARRLEFKANA